MPSARLFWAGLDPDKPEPLDKVLAALHCFHVAPPSVPDAFYFKFTVNREDHHRIGNGFPELQELIAAISQGHPDSIRWPIPFEFDPSTGNLAIMAASVYANALAYISHDCYRAVANRLESLGQHDNKLIGQLALAVELSLGLPNQALQTFHSTIGLKSTAENKAPACLIALFNGGYEGASKYAQFITEHPEDTHTVVAIQLGLPGQLDSERKLQRLAQKSFVSVFTMVNGSVKTAVQHEPLSAPGGGVELWLSDLVKERESLPDEFVRPLLVDVKRRHHRHHQPNITIPYATILDSALKSYRHWKDDNPSTNTAKSCTITTTTPRSSVASGSGKRPSSALPRSGPMSPRGGKKQSLSTPASRLVANGLFHGHADNKQQQLLSTFAQQPASIRAGEDVFKDNKRRVTPDGHQRAQGATTLSGRRRSPLVASPAKIMTAPSCRRLLARFPRKW
ncbi:hypothetical protein OQA88_10733 [Cercophora sp. LCS_1]